MSLTGRGAVRGALGGAAAVLAVVTLPILLTSQAQFALPTLIFVALACLPGAACGALAGRLLEQGRSWGVAAVASIALAVTAVVVAVLLFSDWQLINVQLVAALSGAAALVAVWQSWAMGRRRDSVSYRV